MAFDSSSLETTSSDSSCATSTTTMTDRLHATAHAEPDSMRYQLSVNATRATPTHHLDCEPDTTATRLVLAAAESASSPVPNRHAAQSQPRVRPNPPSRLEMPPRDARLNEQQDATATRVRPVLFIQPASPALSSAQGTETDATPSGENENEEERATTLSASPISATATTPFPFPVASTSAVPSQDSAGSTSPPSLSRSNTTPVPSSRPGGGLGDSPQQQKQQQQHSGGGGLAARRAAKLGNKRGLSLVVPTPQRSNSADSSSSLLSPTTPSHLHPTTLATSSTGVDPAASAPTAAQLSFEASETRSLPPSPISLVTFIGTEGAEQPDRTIGRLMLKQQADEMREQMRGGRGMKRRTSIPRLNLAVAATGVPSKTLSSPRGQESSAPSFHSSEVRSKGGGGGGRPAAAVGSAVEYLRRDSSEQFGRSPTTTESEPGAVEEFPYAFGPREILPGIFLGSEQNARDASVLSEWEFGFVLNVAKEVDCPWLDEECEDEEENGVEHQGVSGMNVEVASERDEGEEADEDEREREGTDARKDEASCEETSGGRCDPVEEAVKVDRRKRGAQHHRRTRTHAAIERPKPTPSTHKNSANADAARPVRPPFIRPTASTPNLQSVFRRRSSSPPPPLPVAHVPPKDAVQEKSRSPSSSSSRPKPRTSPLPRAGTDPETNSETQRKTRLTTEGARSNGAVRFPRNRTTGRPALEYLWLKWGHDESDLVEAHKFQSAFDFMDEARARGERVLVHCQCGVSRSATVVIAYCMREAAKALEQGSRDVNELSGCTGMHDTYSFVKEKSEWVGPNLGLVFQLVAYERTLRGDSNDPAEFEGHHYPPEPVEPHPPQTPASLDDNEGSQFSTPELHLPLSPTFSSGTQQSSVTTTPISTDLAHGISPPRIARPGERDDTHDVVECGDRDRDDLSSELGHLGDRHGSSETLKGEPAVFVLSPPPPSSSSDLGEPNSLAWRHEAVSPTVSTYPSRPLEMPSSAPAAKGRLARARPPRISLDVHNLSAHSLVPSPTTTTFAAVHASPSPSSLAHEQRPTPASSSSSTSTRPNETTRLEPLTTAGLARSTPPESSLSPSSNVLASPRSAVTTSSTSDDGSNVSSRRESNANPSPATSTSINNVKKFGAQSKSERRASHRRVFSETIQVPTSVIKQSWSSHSLHTAASAADD